jgi:hypothetical protein
MRMGLIPLRPLEFILSQSFVIKHKAGVFPEQTFDFSPLLIGERIQPTIKRIMTKLTFNNRRKPPMGFAKINRLSVKINLCQL